MSKVIISASLVRYFRRGLRRELGASIASLAVIVDTTLDPEAYQAALARFDEARALFEIVGVLDRADQLDLEVDLDRSPHLVLRALESQHKIERMRLEDAAAVGTRLPKCHVPALNRLVSDVRAKTGIYPPPTRRRSFLEQRLAAWLRARSRRGDG